MTDATYGGIEAGGTKFVCAVGNASSGELQARTRIATTTPEETLRAVLSFFESHAAAVRAVGIGAFGPVDDDPASPTYGFVTNTPKTAWQHTDVRGPLQEALGVPVAFGFDVDAAALGEATWGAGRGCASFVYLTVGTGIGGSLMLDAQPWRGLTSPEMGHVRLPRAPGDDFGGHCPFHGDCLEGLAAGPAIEARWGTPAAELPPGHPAWAMEAHYLGTAIANLACTLAPERVVLGGGVMSQEHLFHMIRDAAREQLGGYLDIPALTGEASDDYVVPAALEGDAGVRGALLMAQRAAASSEQETPAP